MRKNRYKNYHCNEGCPVEFALEKMGGKWKGMIIFQLLEGKKRFSELQKINTQLTQKVLTKQLRELEADGLVHREVFPVIPPKTEYSLTEAGHQLRPIIQGLEKWGTSLMQSLLVFALVNILSLNAWALDEYLQAQCQKLNGTMIQQWTCPQSGKIRNQDFCVIENQEKQPLIFNGCSGAIGGYDKVFFEACFYHDLCYHHEPSSNGYTKEYCDKQFLIDMVSICKIQNSTDKDCEGMALWFYRAVDWLGGSAWSCSKESARYPQRHSPANVFMNIYPN